MTEVKEAKALPERHFYVDEDEIEDDEAEVGDDSAVQEIEQRQVQLSFKEFLYRLVECAKIFGQLVSNYTGVPAIDRHLGHLRMIKAAQTYGFLMHLRVGGIDDATFIKILKLTENFILRRHVCRERANETETLFAKLCHIDPKDALKKTITAYREACPSDDKFREEFASAAFTSNIIDRARYCLSQIELAQHGKYSELLVSGSDEVHVEHIIPQKIKSKRSKEDYGDWISYLGDRATIKHPKAVSRIGNLTLFAGTLNIVASNNPFSMKKKSYAASSILMTQELAEMRDFRFQQVEVRSKALAHLAVTRWHAP